MERADDEPQAPVGALMGTRLNLKALRLATHGWSLGNPLVYKPSVSDLCAVARELASAGAASGTLVLNDTQMDGDVQHAVAHAVLILRPAGPHAPLGPLVARGVAEVAGAALGLPCAVQGRWAVILQGGEQPLRRLCRVSVEERAGATLVELRFALDLLWAAGSQGAEPAAPLFRRADWREVFLARTLHTLDGHLRALVVA